MNWMYKIHAEVTDGHGQKRDIANIYQVHA